MVNVKDIMANFNEALKERNFYAMTQCVIAMKEISPEFVDVMLSSLDSERDQEMLQINVNIMELRLQQ